MLAVLPTIAVFGAFAIGCWAALNVFATKKPRATERLEEIKNPTRRRKKEGGGDSKPSETKSETKPETKSAAK